MKMMKTMQWNIVKIREMKKHDTPQFLEWKLFRAVYFALCILNRRF